MKTNKTTKAKQSPMITTDTQLQMEETAIIEKPKKDRALQECRINAAADAGIARAILARNLKIYRAYFHLTQIEMSQKVGMSNRGYGKLERCEVAASLDTMDKLSHGTGIPANMLLDDRLFSPLEAK